MMKSTLLQKFTVKRRGILLISTAVLLSGAIMFFLNQRIGLFKASTTDPVGYWKLDEGYGSTAFDAISGGNNGTLGTGSSAPTWITEDQCVSAKCLNFDGSNDFVSLGNPTALQITGSQTISMWIKPSNFSARRNPFAKAYGGEGTITQETSGVLNYYYGTNGGNSTPYQGFSSGQALSLNRWSHVAIVRDLSAMTLSWYFDGVFVNSTTANYSSATSGSNTAYIGRGYTSNYAGFIDDVKVYAYARTADQIKADFLGVGTARGSSAAFGSNTILGVNQKVFSDGLVGYWKMDEASANTCTGGTNDSCDSSGNGNDAAWTGNTTSSNGKYGNGTSYDGTGDYIVAGTSPSLSLTSYSLSAWVKTTDTDGRIIVKRDSSSPNYINYILDTTTCQMHNSIGTFFSAAINGSTDGNWHNLTCTFDGTNIKSYKDGSLQNTTLFTGSVVSIPAISTTLGRDISTGHDLLGQIDEARIYNRALDAREVRALYDFAPGPVAYYSMDENSGSSAYDTSGNGNVGTLVSSPSWVPGKFASALQFDGTNSVTVADSNSLDISKNLSVGFWAKLSGVNYSTANSTKAPGTAADDASVGTISWTNVSNALVNDAANASAGIGLDDYFVYSHYLKVTNFGFSLPSNATVDGIVVTVDGSKSGSVIDSEAKIVKGGTIGSTNKAWGGWPFTATPYGSSSDLWGETWTYSDINSSTFGFAINAYYTDYNSTANVDVVDITVYYTVGGVPYAVTKGVDAYAVGVDASQTYTGILNTSQTLTADTDTNWRYVMMTYDGTNQKMFIDGVQSNSSAYTSAVATNSTGLTIGSNVIGIIDDVKIYNYARSSGQIIQDMNGGHPAPGSPVGSALLHLKLDEGYGTTANDSGSNGDSGDLVDGPTWTNGGKFSKALTFDGLNDRIQALTSNPFEYTYGSGDLTLSLWFKPNVSDSDGGYLISKPWNGSGHYNYRLNYTSSKKVNIHLHNGTTVQTVVTGNTALTSGAWTHVVATYNETTGTASLYLNGNLDATGTYSYTSYTASDSNLSLVVGCLYPYNSGWAGVTTHCVQGDIDEVKIYRGLLSADQVKVEYNQGKSQILGAKGTDSSGNPDNSASREYCVPGDTSTCNAPVGEWKMDEGSGTSINDTSEYGNTGTLGTGSSAPSWSIGKKGNGLSFDGAGDYVSMGTGMLNSIVNGAGAVTLTAWVNINDINDTVNLPPVARLLINGTAVGYQMRVVKTGGEQLCIGSRSTGADAYIETCTPQTIIGQGWLHFTGVVDYQNAKITTYVNGVSIGVGTTLPYASTTYTAGTPSSDDRIGRHQTSATFFDGRIDDVRIYNYARTPAQIAWEYNKGAPVAWYRLDECTGTTAYNAALNGNGQAAGNNGTITIGGSGSNTTAGTCSTSGAWFDGAAGKIGSSIEFDGTDDYVGIGGTYSTNGVTWSAWVKPSSVSSDQMFIGPASGINSAWYFRIYQSKPFFSLRTSDNVQRTLSGNTTLANGNWYHLLATYDNDKINIYVNGVIDAQSSSYALPVYNGVMGIGNIGRWTSGDPRYFTGQIDDVRIYNYALSSSQVKTVYNNGAVSFK